jgi:polysaccharide deacetylase 2 family uncharacterized protein YibQ
MPRTRKSKSEETDKKSSAVPTSVKFFTVLMVVLAVGGGIGVKYLKTSRGGVFLADHGAVMAYARVQRDASSALKGALETQGLRRNIRVIRGAGDNKPITWDIPCVETIDLLQVNVLLTEAIQSKGLVVRRSEEFDDGRRLVFDVGTHKLDTHRLTLRRVPADIIASQLAAAKKQPKLALVIDDFGYNTGGIAREVLDLEIPLTVAILPTLRFSRDVLNLAKKKNRCVLLHVPMEGAYRNGGDVEAVTVGMSDEEIAGVMRRHVESLPGVDGVNNHQGSLATADARVMKAVMGSLAGRDLFFLDSLTSPKSLAYNAAIDAGLRAVQNSMFIDDDTERREDVAARLRTLVDLALTRGTAIGIGHPHPWTLEALRDNLDYLESAGVELVTVCELMEGRAGGAQTGDPR